MMIASHQPAGAEPTMASAAIVPGPDWTLTFVLLNSGVHTGHWSLPAGPIGPGESAEQAARREAETSAGVRPGPLAPTGIYDVHGRTDGLPYRFRLHVYRALQPCTVTDGFVPNPTDVAEVGQAHPHDILPHPTHMRILNDAGLADFDPALVQRLLETDGVAVTRQDL
ncbi:NUDIX domain-containing protein [Nocardiopsis gilva YIM 90087]|uniref:NUDIX domain-containing protein n=1 Tax=Nocardiopsis gilva YIM 90087 TaxID=1235441 RepID=A0A223S0I3_9ACTN|nr:NUDIX domain-containing protein [Nocardiopsis gilva]ASU81645.1 NUDIX domain-containing protein [Nocardiopsis gilva YIM 90087]